MMNQVDKQIGKLAYFLWEKKEGGNRLAEHRRLQEQAYWAPERLKALQIHKLNQLLKHAQATSPWYRRQMQQLGIDPGKQTISLTDFRRFPITTKANIRESTDEFISSQYNKDSLNKAKTGGSTGVSLNLFFDERCQQYRNAAQMFADGLAGWETGSRVAAVWGNPPVAETLKEKIRWWLLERTIYLDTMDLNPKSMSDFVQSWRSYQPEVVFGHSHSIYIFAQFLVDKGINDLRPKGIVTTSMMLLDQERRIIEQAFACPVTNRYGCEEVGLIAVECETHQGMHINSPHIILECLDGNDQPCAPGEPGKLVITDLNNYGMPLIRYRVEDVGVLGQETCSCGRQLPLLQRLEGRVADFLKKKDGGQVAGVSLVERTLTKIPGIQQMQLVQESLDELIINRVKGPEYQPETDAALEQEFRQVFGDQVRLLLKDVEKIPQEKSGKYRFSICKI